MDYGFRLRRKFLILGTRIKSQRSLAWGFFCDILTNLNFGCLAFDF